MVSLSIVLIENLHLWTEDVFLLGSPLFHQERYFKSKQRSSTPNPMSCAGGGGGKLNSPRPCAYVIHNTACHELLQGLSAGIVSTLLQQSGAESASVLLFTRTSKSLHTLELRS